MHRKRVTSELHDSYFRLMTIKHSISKIQWTVVWALSYYLTQLSWVPEQLPADVQRERGPLESPDWVDPNISWTRKTQRDGHNSEVKIWSLCSVSRTLSHANHEQPFRTLEIKWEVKYNSKDVSCVFLPASLSCVLHSCVILHASVFDIVSLWCLMMM